MIGAHSEATTEKIEEFKSLVSEELTKYASSILLDRIWFSCFKS